MADPIKRTEITHIDEVQRASTSAVQWLLEQANIAGTHPISHNNKLTFLIGGEEAFADIAKHIRQAKVSIDLCCWGFDPGMELERSAGGGWPRGDTYGDLLIAAGKRGVKVRLLVWYDAVAVNSANPRNMPGHTHDTFPPRWLTSEIIEKLSASNSAAEALKDARLALSVAHLVKKVESEVIRIRAKARRDYCRDWYVAAFSKALGNIEIRTRSGDANAIATSLKSEANPPSSSILTGPEREGMLYFGTHHQKPILIDYCQSEAGSAVGYIMGLNSLTEYWDTVTHLLDDSRREYEHAIGVEPTPGCAHLRPLRDYACRLDGGYALAAIYENFIKAWDRAGASHGSSKADGKHGKQVIPAVCLRKAEPGDSTVQIIRTQPEEGDKTIRDAYFQATDQATLASGYLYLENQYFQYSEWAQRLLKTRKQVIRKWDAACVASGKTRRDMPILHIFIVIPMPERKSMIPRTYDTLAELGQQGGMTKQRELIEEANAARPQTVYGGIGQTVTITPKVPEVIEAANRIAKPSIEELEAGYGLKVCTAMLNACDLVDGKWKYREIYIHSKLLLIDDIFLTLGSANLNQRSMAVDSEINLAAISPDKASDLRKKIWSQLTNDEYFGGDGSRKEIALSFKGWRELMSNNSSNKKAENEISCPILNFEDGRSSVLRLG